MENGLLRQSQLYHAYNVWMVKWLRLPSYIKRSCGAAANRARQPASCGLPMAPVSLARKRIYAAHAALLSSLVNRLATNKKIFQVLVDRLCS